MASNIEQRLETLTAAVQKLISTSVAPVAPVAPIAPVLPVVQPYSGDHDLLTKLDTKVDAMQITLDKITSGLDKNITPEQHKELIQIVQDHETRIRENTKDITKVMTWGVALVVFLGVIEFVINMYIKSR